jgi:NAD(P)H-dependent FMN reductase
MNLMMTHSSHVSRQGDCMSSIDNRALRIQVIVASTRPGRVGLPIAQWVRDRLEADGYEVDFADLAEIDLPLFNEPKHPRLKQYEHEHTKEWSARVEAADAFIFVMPEYNHSYTAPLKNAIDYLSREWAHKPVGFVSYGGVVGGTRAVQALKPVLAALKMTPIVEAVVIPFVGNHVAGGEFHPTEPMDQALDTMIGELAKVSTALAPLRESNLATA